MKITVALIIVLVLVSSISAAHISLPYKQTLNKGSLLSSVSANFEVKDSDGNPIENALIIIQGISDTEFNKNIVTGSDGKASISLNSGEIFFYAVYKLSYEPVSENIFINSDENIKITLEKSPENKWYFYYENNGEIEVKFKSLDLDTNYLPGEYVNEILEVKNILDTNIQLVKEETSMLTVDSETLDRLRWWGGIRPQDILKGELIDITLKQNGWLQTKIEDGNFELCVGNALGEYKGQKFDLSGSEFICEKDVGNNLIPEWILENNYKIYFNATYMVNGEKKRFSLLTQDFFIQNPDQWKPKLELISPGNFYMVNKEIIYQIPREYPDNFVYYSLLNPPAGMTIDKVKGIIKWIPPQSGRYKINVRAYYPYFEHGSKEVHTDGEFELRIIDEYCPINNRKKVSENIFGEKSIKFYCR